MKVPIPILILQRVVVFFFLTMLVGCVGYVKSDLQYVERRIELNIEKTGPLRTKAEVEAKFGKPLRAEQDKEVEIWYYLIDRKGAGGETPIKEGGGVIFLVLVPVPWTTKVEDNIKFLFRGQELVQMFELVDKASGFVCGVGGHPYGTGCKLN